MDKDLLHAVGLVFAACVVTTAVSSCTPSTEFIDPPDDQQRSLCEKNSECADGFVCESGQCRQGECTINVQDECNQEDTPEDVAPYCCEIWQLCTTLNRCGPNPDSPVDTECRVDDDCPGLGEFCSGGTCYATQGRDSCTASFQCPTGERCDRTVFLCVPDIGGCDLADRGFPELACEEGQLCDTETGFCVDPGGAECTADTVEEDCRANQQCDMFGRCVQCISDEDCGPGTDCNEGTGNCVSTVNTCETDDDCEGEGRRCSDALGECVRPQCERDADCEDSREICDLAGFICILPPAVCEGEMDEPNDSAGSATDIADGYAGTICRGNTDFLGFDINPDKRYRVTVGFPDFNTEGIQVALFDTQGLVIDTASFGSFDDEVVVTGISGVDETGQFQLRIVGGGTEEDIWSYSIGIEETAAPMQVDCSDTAANGEPNDAFGDAFSLTAGDSRSFGRCGASDIDYYVVTVPPLNGIEVTVEHETEDGDLDVYLYDELDGDSVDSSTSGNAVEKVEAPEGATTFYIKVQLWSGDSDANTNQTYTLTVNAIPRPAACDADINEPDSELANAGALAFTDNAASADAIRCGSVDADYWEIVVPADRGGQVAVDFDHDDGDLRLDLLDAAGEVIDSSNESTSGASTEIIPIPPAGSEQTFYGRVRLHSGSGAQAQTYTIRASTFDASACTLTEPVANDTFLEGTCYGTVSTDDACNETELTIPGSWPTLTTCENASTREAGCGSVCGVGDVDYYRVGKLNNDRLLRAKLTHTASAGVLSLAIVRQAPDGSLVKQVFDNNTDENDTLELATVVPSVAPVFEREWGIVVEPTGAAGEYMAQPYAIEIDVGAACAPDGNDDAAPRNDTPSGATLIQPGTINNVTLCGNDVDVYRVVADAGEQITATLTGLDGATVNIGRPVPGNFDAEAETVTGGCGIEQGSGTPCDPLPDVSTLTSPVRARYTVPAGESDAYYLTVKRAPDGDVGSYSLAVTVN